MVARCCPLPYLTQRSPLSTGRRCGRPRAHGREPPRLHEVLLRCAGRWAGGRMGAPLQLVLLHCTTAPTTSPLPSPEPPPVRIGGWRHGWPRDDPRRPPVAGHDSHINDGGRGGRSSGVRGAGRRSYRWRCRPQDDAPSRGSAQPVWPGQRCRVVRRWGIGTDSRALLPLLQGTHFSRCISEYNVLASSIYPPRYILVGMSKQRVPQVVTFVSPDAPKPLLAGSKRPRDTSKQTASPFSRAERDAFMVRRVCGGSIVIAAD